MTVCPFYINCLLSQMKSKHLKKGQKYDQVAVVILAAGLGTRMKSDRAKVLHEINGLPMIRYVVATAQALAAGQMVVVVGHQADEVRAALADHARLEFAHQDQQLGTGHAVMCALSKILEKIEHVVVLCGDVPLLKPVTVSRLIDDHFNAERDVTLLAVEVADPTGYGRIVMESDRKVTAIVEEADASQAERQICIINAGIYCINNKFLQGALDKLRTDNAQGEYYLTDIVGIAHGQSKSVGVVVGDDPVEVAGVNDRVDLEVVQKAIRAGSSKIS